MANDLTVEVANLLAEQDEPTSSRAPVTRAEEERAVARVERPRRDPLAVSDNIADVDMSPVARYVQQLSQLPAVTQQFVADYNTIAESVRAKWDLAQRFLSLSAECEAGGDYGRASLLMNRAGIIWQEATPQRQTMAQMEQIYQANQVRVFQINLLAKHPWLKSAKHYDQAIEWAMGHYGVSRQEAEFASPEDIITAAVAYEQHCRATGTRLAPPTPKGKKPTRSNPAGLSQGQKVAIVSELLAGIK